MTREGVWYDKQDKPHRQSTQNTPTNGTKSIQKIKSKAMTKRDHYHILGLLIPVLIDHIDALENTNQYKFQLKNRAKLFLTELEKVNKEFHEEIMESDRNFVPKFEGDPRPLDLYMNISKAYDLMAEIFTMIPAWRMPYLLERFKKELKADFSQDLIHFDKIQR